MPPANRHFLPGYVWHITHRCHQKKFLLKSARERRRYLYWVFEAKKRLGLSVLDYRVTSNHIRLLVKDMGVNVIAESMQLIGSRTVQEYIGEAYRDARRKRSFNTEFYRRNKVPGTENTFLGNGNVEDSGT